MDGAQTFYGLSEDGALGARQLRTHADLVGKPSRFERAVPAGSSVGARACGLQCAGPLPGARLLALLGGEAHVKFGALIRRNDLRWYLRIGWLLLLLLAGLPAAVSAQTPLSLEVRGTPNPAAPGDIVRYTMHVANLNTTTPSGAVTLRVNIPQYVTLGERPDAYTASGTRFGSYVEWRFTDIAPGESFTRQFAVLIDNTATNPPPPDNTTLTVEVTATASGTTFTRTTSTLVRTSAVGLDLSVQGSSGRVAANATLSYELRYGNSSDAARSAFLRLPLPAGTSFVSASGGGTESGGAVQWDLGTLQAGVSDRRFVTVRVPAGAPLASLVVADAELKADAAGAVLVRAYDVAVVGSPSNLELQLSASPDPVSPGGMVVCKLFVSNRNGSTPTGNFDIVVNIPKKATLLDRPNAYTASGTRFGSYLLYRFTPLDPGESMVRQFTLQVDNTSMLPPPPNGTILPVEAYINAQGGSSASTAITVDNKVSLDLALGLEPSAPGPGQNVVYRVSFGNTSQTSDQAGLLRLPVPTGTSFVSASAGGTESNGVVQWSLGTINHGFSDLRTATFKVADGTANGVLIGAEAEISQPTSNITLVRRAAVATVASSNALSLSVTATPEAVVGGNTVVYRMMVTNSGSIPAEAFDLTINIPEYATLTERPGAYTATGTRFGDTLLYRYASLMPNAVAMNQFTVTIDNSAMNPPPNHGHILHTDFQAGKLRVDKDIVVGVAGSGGGPGGNGGSGSDAGSSSASDAGVDGGSRGGGADAGGRTDASASNSEDADAKADDEDEDEDGENDAGRRRTTTNDEGGSDGGCDCAVTPRSRRDSLLSTLLGIALVYALRRRRQER